MAGVPAKFPPIAVKLNGEMAAIKPWGKYTSLLIFTWYNNYYENYIMICQTYLKSMTVQ